MAKKTKQKKKNKKKNKKTSWKGKRKEKRKNSLNFVYDRGVVGYTSVGCIKHIPFAYICRDINRF
jgi:hypothetical protein